MWEEQTRLKDSADLPFMTDGVFCHHSDPLISLPPTLATTPPSANRAGRLLIVEPELERQRLLQNVVDIDGYETIYINDGDEVLRLTAEFEPDLILLSAELPSGNGFEVCGDLRAKEPGRHCPIIMLGSDDEASIARGLLAGADDYIGNLHRLMEVRARIRVQLRNKRFFDALQRVRMERDNLRRDVRLDALTGVLNRRALERSVTEHCAASENFGVLFVDVDHFKSVNDLYGHGVGDIVLRATAEVLKAGIRPGDVIGRYGGEEFVILVAGAGPESCRLVAERLRCSVHGAALPRPGPRLVTVSIGATVFDSRQHDEIPSELLRRADGALYAAKDAGRDRVVFHGAADTAAGAAHVIETPAPHASDLNPSPYDGS